MWFAKSCRPWAAWYCDVRNCNRYVFVEQCHLAHLSTANILIATSKCSSRTLQPTSKEPEGEEPSEVRSSIPTTREAKSRQCNPLPSRLPGLENPLYNDSSLSSKAAVLQMQPRLRMNSPRKGVKYYTTYLPRPQLPSHTRRNKRPARPSKATNTMLLQTPSPRISFLFFFFCFGLFEVPSQLLSQMFVPIPLPSHPLCHNIDEEKDKKSKWYQDNREHREASGTTTQHSLRVRSTGTASHGPNPA